MLSWQFMVGPSKLCKKCWTPEWTACRAVIELSRSSVIRSGSRGDGGCPIFVVELEPNVVSLPHDPHRSLLVSSLWWFDGENLLHWTWILRKSLRNPYICVMSKPQDSHHSLSVFSSRWFDGKDHLYRTNLQVKKFWIYKKEYGEPIYVHSITASRPSPLSLSLFFHIQKPGHMVSLVLWHSSFSLEVSSFRWFDGKNLGFLFKMIWWQGSSLQNKLTYYRVLISATTK